MSNTQLAGNGFGGVIQGNYGTYVQAADGTFTVDTRDVVTLLALGLTYVSRGTASYSPSKAPAAATAGAIVASGALSDGAVAITAQPDVMRQVEVVVGAGTLAISAGTIAVTYVGNDGIVGTDTLPLATAAAGTTTLSLSRGVNTISVIEVAGLVGGAAPFVELSTTSAISLPVGPESTDLAIIREYDAGATVAIGAVVPAALATVTPTTAPNGTVTYGFLYSFVTPTA